MKYDCGYILSIIDCAITLQHEIEMSHFFSLMWTFRNQEMFLYRWYTYFHSGPIHIKHTARTPQFNALYLITTKHADNSITTKILFMKRWMIENETYKYMPSWHIYNKNIFVEGYLCLKTWTRLSFPLKLQPYWELLECFSTPTWILEM